MKNFLSKTLPVLLAYISARLKEPSTRRALIVALGAIGITLTPEQSAAIIAVFLGIISLYWAVVPDAAPQKDDDDPASSNEAVTLSTASAAPDCERQPDAPL